jgi:hypothetical protein
VALLDSNSYKAIRGALSKSLDGDTLPDDDIEDPMILGRAESYIASRTSDTGEHAKKATIFYAASLLAHPMQGQIAAAVAIRTGGVTVRFDADKAKAELLSQMEEELAAIQGEDVSETWMPTFFAAAPGGRGR